MEINALGYLGIASPRYQEWKTFGPEILSLALGPEGADGTVRLRMDERHHRLAIHPGAVDEVAYLGWELPSSREFDRALQELDLKGVSYRMATQEELADRHVLGMAVLSDPASFRHELYYGQEFIPASFQPARPMSGFVAGDLGGLGHCVLVVPELTSEFRKFALDILGFRVFTPVVVPGPNPGQRIAVEFYRCNVRSHCLAWLPAPGLRGLAHTYIETNSMDDVGRAFDRARAQEGIVSLELGRLAPDTDVSFYVRTPSGFDVQYATGGLRIDPREPFVTQSFSVQNSTVWGHKQLLKGFGSCVRPVGRRGTGPGPSG